jgi:hypothetical protein
MWESARPKEFKCILLYASNALSIIHSGFGRITIFYSRPTMKETISTDIQTTILKLLTVTELSSSIVDGLLIDLTTAQTGNRFSMKPLET